MVGRIPDAMIEDIRQRIDIVEVISRYVAMEKRGKNYLALCPFHQEKTPSFNINPEKQIFHCFGCGAGGNVFKFVMMVEGLSFPEAVKSLGAKVGVDIPEEISPRDQAYHKKKDRAYKIYSLVRDYYRFLLTSDTGAGAVQYLEKRQLSDAARNTFELGYAPPNWDSLTKLLLSKGISGEELTKLGLVQAKESGGFYDRFRNRIMFPIWDNQGRVIGFGGRTMGEDTPKYLNSPEGEFFNKGQLLYGLHIARKGIREQGYAVLMEGYMDVVSTFQKGVINAVASLGTAFTRDQGKLLMTYTHNVVIAYDADAAGTTATLRAAEILQELGAQVSVATLIGAKDPDEFIQSQGLAAWQQVIEKALSLIQFKLDQAVKKYGIQNSAAKERVLQEVLPNLAVVASPIELEDAIKQTATVLQVNWETVLEAIRNYKKNARKKSQLGDNSAKVSHNIASDSNYGKPKRAADARSQAETSLLRLILEDKIWLDRIAKELGTDFFQFEGYHKIFQACLKLGKDYTPTKVLDTLEEPLQSVVSQLLMREIPRDHLDQILKDLICTIKKTSEKAKLEDLLVKLAAAEQAGNSQRVYELSREINAAMKSEGPERGVAT